MSDIFDEFQLRQLEICKNKGIDYLRWYDPKWGAWQMQEFRYCVEDGIDYTLWYDNKWSQEQMMIFKEIKKINSIKSYPLKENNYIALVNDNYFVFKNDWSSGRAFIYDKLSKLWTVGCFEGDSNELLEKAKADGEEVYNGYKNAVDMLNSIVEVD